MAGVLRAKRSNLLRSTHPYPSPTPYPLYPPLPLQRRGGEEGTNAKPEPRRYEIFVVCAKLVSEGIFAHAKEMIEKIKEVISYA
jgi:hypothetical protein